MPVYAYRCRHDGSIDADQGRRHFDVVTEVVAPMGQAPASVPCRDCAMPAHRMFTVPALALWQPADPRLARDYRD